MASLNPPNTPYKSITANNALFRYLLRTVPQQQDDLASDMLGRCIGPVGPRGFMTSYMQTDEKYLAKMPQNVKWRIPKGTKESRLYIAFVSTLSLSVGIHDAQHHSLLLLYAPAQRRIQTPLVSEDAMHHQRRQGFR